MIGNLLNVLASLTILLIAALSWPSLRLTRIRVPIRVAHADPRREDEGS